MHNGNIAANQPAYTTAEVRTVEKRRKKATRLGGGGSQAPGDPLRPYGKQDPQRPVLTAQSQGIR